MSNPYEHDDRDGLDREEETPAVCHGCDGYLPADSTQWRLFNGWPYCLDCYCALAPVVEDLTRSHRMDEERDEFNRVRR